MSSVGDGADEVDWVPATPDRARHIEVNRTRIRAWCWGDPTDPPVVLTHGAFDHGRMWDHFAPRFASLGFHAVAIDVRGHGDSGRLASGMLWSAATIDLLELARVLAEEAGTPGEPIGMIGHSMGGGQVLTAAGTMPERVAWAVTVDGLGPPATAFDEPPLVPAATEALDRIVMLSGRPPRVWRSLEEMAERRGQTNFRLPMPVLRHLADHGAAATEGGWVWKADPIFNTGLPDGFSLEMILAGYEDVTSPVLALMASEHDAWNDLDDAEIQRRIDRFPDARWRSVPGAGHYAHIERPEFVLTEIESFLRDLGALR